MNIGPRAAAATSASSRQAPRKSCGYARARLIHGPGERLPRAANLGDSYPRVDHTVEHVDDETSEHDRTGDEQHEALDHGQVKHQDRRLEVRLEGQRVMGRHRSHKCVTEWMKSAMDETATSIRPPARTAATVPNGTATRTAIKIANVVSSRVTGRRASTASRTGMGCRNDRPRSPVTAWPSQST